MGAAPTPKAAAPNLWRIEEGRLHLSLHPGQGRAWQAQNQQRFNFILAGTQSGKSSFLPWLLDKRIRATADPAGGTNDYLAVTSSFDLFKLKFLPEIRNVLEHISGSARYWSGDRILELRDPRTGKFWAKRKDDVMWGRVILRSAASKGGLESASARGAILDECGQEEFQLETWEAILRRLSLYQGGVDAGTTLYDLGWLKTEVWDRWQRIGTLFEQSGDRDFNVINFDSTENPAFSQAEFDRARSSMPEWRFNMFYRGLFTRPVGQIYDCFIDADIEAGGHKMRPRPIPDEWHRVAGADFGVVNTCFGLYAAVEDEDGYPTGQFWLYRIYHAGSRNATEHVEKLREIEPRLSLVTGGAASEDEWRTAYLWAGLPIYRPVINAVEVGIDRVYGATKQNNLIVFDTETAYVEQKKSYARELDERGESTTRIKDKEKYHRLDQERYMASLFCPLGDTMLPFEPRRHLIVKGEATKKLPPHWKRFGGIMYRDGAPSAFVLCATDERGGVIVDAEVYLPALTGSDFGKAVWDLLEAQGVPDVAQTPGGVTRRTMRILCNDDIFLPRKVGEVNGPSIVDMLRRVGLMGCQKAGGDGVNEWSIMGDWLGKDLPALPGSAELREAQAKGEDAPKRAALRVNRLRCSVLSLTLPLIVGDPKTPGAAHPDSPSVVAQALCHALMLRPQPSQPVVSSTVDEQLADIPGGVPAGLRKHLEQLERDSASRTPIGSGPGGGRRR